MAESSDLPETAAPAPGRVRAGLPPAGRRRRRRGGLHQPVGRAVGHHRVGPQRGPRRRGRHRRPGDRQPHAHRRAGHHRAARRPQAARDGASVDDDRGPGRRPGRPHPRLRHARHPRQPQEGRPHRRRPSTWWARCCRSSRSSTSARARSRRPAGPAPARSRWSGCATSSSRSRRVEHLAVCDGEAPDVDEFLDLIASRYPRDQHPHRPDRRRHRHPRRPPGRRHLLPRRRGPTFLSALGARCDRRSRGLTRTADVVTATVWGLCPTPR